MDREKTGIVFLFSIFFMMSLLIGSSFQNTFGQSSTLTLDTFDQEQIEKFRDLWRKGLC